MALTYFYAELFGILFAVMGFAMLVNQSMMRTASREMIENRGTLLITSIVTLFLGLIVTLTHNIWNGPLIVYIVTIIGWLMVIKGAVLMLLPHATLRRIYGKEFSPVFWTILGLIVLIIGAYITWSGFTGAFYSF